MNKNLHSKTVLTEFSRNFDEDLQDTVLTKFVNKIYVACSVNQQEVPEASSSSSSSLQTEENESRDILPDSFNEASCIPVQSTINKPKNLENKEVERENSNVEYQVDTSLGRTPLNVIKRISNLLAMKDMSDLNDYKNTELKKLWMPDSKSRDCYDCNIKFNTFRRKHHCRLCGQIFCSKCCNQIIPGKIIKCSGELRVCNYCSKVVLSYLKSADINAELKSDLQALEDDLSNKFVTSMSNSANSGTQSESFHQRKTSVGYQEERLVSNPNVLSTADRKNILQQSNPLKSLHEDMIQSLQNQERGSEILNFLLNNQRLNKEQATAVLNAMIEAGFIIPILSYENTETPEPDDSFLHEFSDSIFYKLPNFDEIAVKGETQHAVGSSNREETEKEDIVPTSIYTEQAYSSNADEELQSSLKVTVGSKPLLESYCQHEEMFLSQLLRNENLDLSWSRILINQCARIAHTIHPEYCNTESIDVRNFVNIKKFSGGSKNDCTIVGGVVFSKNVSHKGMKIRIDNPRILLLKCPVSYQRVEGKFVTIETLILQEKEYLRNVTSRILSYGPNVVVAHKDVAGIAQDMLREKGITLVLDVKLQIIERLSQCLECDIVTSIHLASIDSKIGIPKLGTCKKFYTKSFNDENGLTKTLMFFDIPYSQRGCSLLLRGGNNQELAKVKKVARFLLFARYNFRLELSYLLDVFAKPPRNICSSIFDSNIQTELVSSTKSLSNKEEVIVEPMKIESVKKEKIMNIENVFDFSDPLRAISVSTCELEKDSIELEVQYPFDNRFRTSLSSSILSISPFVTFPLPYFETEAGKKCLLRKFFPPELFYSTQWSNKVEKIDMPENRKESDSTSTANEFNIEFMTLRIKAPADHASIQTAIADYRRNGSAYQKVTRMKKIEKKSTINRTCSTVDTIKDALDMYSHQRLPVLFCSFYYNTRELPTSFCAQPLLLDMHFYGQDDIMLGLFLERYCFRSSYICPSCKLPMMNHVRKYAHSQGVVTVKLAEDPIKNENSNILMTSRCTICNSMTPNVNISKDTWCLSFAKFLELKFHGHSYTRRNLNGEEKNLCSHSIHRDHIQYFSSNGVIVSFAYTPTETWDIQLPPLTVLLKDPHLIDKKIYGEKIKSFSVKGYEVYAKIHEKLANLSTEVESPMLANLKKVLHRDQLIFKHRVEVVYTLLGSNEVYSTEINDAMLMMQKELADSIELWGPRLNEATIQSKNSQKCDNVHQVEAFEETDDEMNDLELDLDSDLTSKPEGFQTDKKEKVDKKMIKRLLSSLLPSSSDQNPLVTPFSPNEHFCLPTGQFPILVLDQDMSSIIAYYLMSYDYKKSLEALASSQGYHSSPGAKRKNQSEGSLETDEKDVKDGSDKKKQNNSHIELHVQDSNTQFTCKIYFAKEFDDLRTRCLKQSSLNGTKAKVEELRKSYARSLSQSQKWEARGGKSGSKFSKTSDDRFILKEMSKQDVGEFDKGEFAPKYFEYVNDCMDKEVPTLLAKIFGVYKVVIKKKESVFEGAVLVIENLFCDRKIVNKYDLKGSERNRLVDIGATRQIEETVLLDENLIKASWTKPLYVLTHSKTVLREAIYRDVSFLEKNCVMDYSLLVGLDEKFLILGIIDYIRKFTIEKRIESYLKQVVDQRLPTIVNPNIYKNRFIEAMEKYFLEIPDRWEGLMKT